MIFFLSENIDYILAYFTVDSTDNLLVNDNVLKHTFPYIERNIKD